MDVNVLLNPLFNGFQVKVALMEDQVLQAPEDHQDPEDPLDREERGDLLDPLDRSDSVDLPESAVRADSRDDRASGENADPQEKRDNKVSQSALLFV